MGSQAELDQALNELVLALLGEEAILPRPGLWPMRLPGLLKRNVVVPSLLNENIIKFAVGLASQGSAFALYWVDIEGWWNSESSIIALC